MKPHQREIRSRHSYNVTAKHSNIVDTGYMATTPPPTTTTPSKVKKPGPGLWPSLILASVGVALFSWALWNGFQSVFEILVVDSFDTPGAQSRQLEAGEYEVYGRVATVDIFDLDVEFDAAIISIDDVSIKNVRTEESIPVTLLLGFTSLTRNRDAFEAVGTFEITEPDDYIVIIGGTEPSRAVFGRTITSFVDRARNWIIFAALGLFLSLLGLVMLIVGLVRRNREKKAEIIPATHVVASHNPAPYGAPSGPGGSSPPESEAPPRPVTPPPPPPSRNTPEDQTPWG
jgi:hypothetical protein